MKCPFCKQPCNQKHCPYFEEKQESLCEDRIKGLQEENRRLKETIKELQNYIINKK